MKDITIKLENVSSTELIWLRKMLIDEISDCREDINNNELWIKGAKDKEEIIGYQANIQMIKDYIETLEKIKKALEEERAMNEEKMSHEVYQLTLEHYFEGENGKIRIEDPIVVKSVYDSGFGPASIWINHMLNKMCNAVLQKVKERE